jgi:hypothetical protein
MAAATTKSSMAQFTIAAALPNAIGSLFKIPVIKMKEAYYFKDLSPCSTKSI